MSRRYWLLQAKHDVSFLPFSGFGLCRSPSPTVSSIVENALNSGWICQTNLQWTAFAGRKMLLWPLRVCYCYHLSLMQELHCLRGVLEARCRMRKWNAVERVAFNIMLLSPNLLHVAMDLGVGVASIIIRLKYFGYRMVIHHLPRLKTWLWRCATSVCVLALRGII